MDLEHKASKTERVIKTCKVLHCGANEHHMGAHKTRFIQTTDDVIHKQGNQMLQELAIVVLAAGKGTRMRSHTTKILHPLAGIPLVAHPIHTAKLLSPERIVLVIGHQADDVKATLDSRFPNDNLRYTIQKEQLGTAHAVMQAQPALVDGPAQFLLLSGDVPLLTLETMQHLQQLHRDQKAAVSLLSFQTDDNAGYGRIVRNKAGDVQCIREHRDCSEKELAITECNAGVYLFDSEFLFSNLQHIDSSNDQQEFYLTDIVEIAAQQDRRVVAHIVENPVEVMGVNDRTQLSFLQDQWEQGRKDALMRSGVTFHMPGTTFLHYDVTIGKDAEIAPNCCLLGNTTIGENAKIGAGSHLTNATIKAGEQVPPHTIR